LHHSFRNSDKILKTMNSCKNDKTKLQMIDSCIRFHEVANWIVVYYKIFFNVASLKSTLNSIYFRFNSLKKA